MIKAVKKGPILEITVPKKWAGITLNHLFQDDWHAPKKLVHEWRMSRTAGIKGRTEGWEAPLSSGDIIQLPLFYSEQPPDFAEYMDIDVLYEDDFVLVLNKPAGMDTHPSQPGGKNSLQNAAACYLMMKGEPILPFHIHRLDKDTTGAILFAKDRLSAAILDQQLKKREVKRTYLALVHGLMKKKQGTIKEKIGSDRHHGSRRRVSASGKDAVTHYEVVKLFPEKNMTLVKCRLDTGRTHQIRVHLSFIGHPLAGDVLYGGRPILPRQALHAWNLRFPHPLTEEWIEVHAPVMDGIFPEEQN
jgi:23S rRNA pseudouridine1911/1915/1917 synthase